MISNFFSLKLYEENYDKIRFNFKNFIKNFFGEHYIYNEDFFQSIQKN